MAQTTPTVCTPPHRPRPPAASPPLATASRFLSKQTLGGGDGGGRAEGRGNPATNPKHTLRAPPGTHRCSFARLSRAGGLRRAGAPQPPPLTRSPDGGKPLAGRPLAQAQRDGRQRPSGRDPAAFGPPSLRPPRHPPCTRRPRSAPTQDGGSRSNRIGGARTGLHRPWPRRPTAHSEVGLEKPSSCRGATWPPPPPRTHRLSQRPPPLVWIRTGPGAETSGGDGRLSEPNSRVSGCPLTQHDTNTSKTHQSNHPPSLPVTPRGI